MDGGADAELRAAVRTSPVPYIRVKALAVLNVARGATAGGSGAGVCPPRERGRMGAAVPAGGRGGVGGGGRSRAAGQVDGAEVSYLRQSPRTFGVAG